MQSSTAVALAARNSKPAISLTAAWSKVCDALDFTAVQGTLAALDPEFQLLAVARHELLQLQEAVTTNHPSVLRELVCKLKVPLRVCSAITKMSKIIGLMSREASRPCCMMALSLLADILEQYELYCKSVPQEASSRASLTAAMQQQVQESGLLQSLPAMITTINTVLVAALKAELEDSVSQHVECVVMITEALLNVQRRLSQLWARGTKSTCQVGPCALSALELAHTAFTVTGRLHKRAQRQSQTTVPELSHKDAYNSMAGTLYSLLVSAHMCVLEVAIQASAANPDSVPELQPDVQRLLASPHLLLCVAVSFATLTLEKPAHSPCAVKQGHQATATAAKAAQAAEAAAGPQSNNSRAGRGSCSQGTPAQSGQQPWTLPEKPSLEAKLASWKNAKKLERQLSTCQCKLFELLGVSNRVVLCLAQAAADTDDTTGVLGLMTLLLLLSARISHWKSQPVAQLRRTPSKQWQFTSRLFLLLPTILLPYAINTRPGDALAVELVSQCAILLEGWVAVRSASAVDPNDCWTGPQPPNVWMSEVLPQAQQMSDLWLQRAAAAVAAASGPDAMTNPESANVAAAGSAAIATPLGTNFSSTLGAAALSVSMLCFLLGPRFRNDPKASREERPASSVRQQPRPTASRETASAAASTHAGTEGRKATKQDELPQEYSLPTGKCLAQLFATFEMFVRLLPSAAALVQPDDRYLTDKLQAALHDVCSTISLGGLASPAYSVGVKSTEQQQLYSLLHSLLKLQRSGLLQDKWDNYKFRHCVLLACEWSVTLFLACNNGLTQQPTDAHSQPGTAGRSRSSSARSQKQEVLQHSTEKSKAKGKPLSSTVPALVLLGRWCLALLDSLQQETDDEMFRLESTGELSATPRLQWRSHLSTFFNIDADRATLMGRIMAGARACARNTAKQLECTGQCMASTLQLQQQLKDLQDAVEVARVVGHVAWKQQLDGTDAHAEAVFRGSPVDFVRCAVKDLKVGLQEAGIPAQSGSGPPSVPWQGL